MNADTKKIPFEHRALRAEEAAELLGVSPRTLVDKISKEPDFPVSLSRRPLAWIAADLIAWRDARISRKSIPRRRIKKNVVRP